jgi:hypothetical protein
LIVLGLLVINKESDFPGWWAVLPTFGAVLIISAGAQAWVNRVVLSNRVLVWFGLISFPLYLWHWPLLSFAYISGVEPLSLGIRIAAVLISIVLAWLTYKFIEKPIRSDNKSNNKVFSLLILMSLVGSIALYFYLNGGLQGYLYLNKEKRDFANYFENSLPGWNYYETAGIPVKHRYDCNFYDLEKYRSGQATQIPVSQIDKTCYTRNPGKKNVLFLWGDSHAEQLYPGLDNNLPEDWQIMIVASSGCPADFSVQEDSTTDYCQRSNWFALKTIKETKPNVVMVAQKDKHEFDKWNKLNDILLKIGVGKVVFIGPSPHWERDFPQIILRKLWNNTPEITFIGIKSV